MRLFLDGLYRLCGALAALFLAAIAVLILAQVVCRLFDTFLPAASDFAGFCLAASSFLALAYTFRAGGHIRVNLLLQRLPLAWRRRVDVIVVAVAAALVAYFAWHSLLLARESWRFNDLSEGLVPVPLWIPQSGMALGLIVLAIALVDELVNLLRGRVPSYEESQDVVLGEQPGAD
jgi:TRAP-type C4-dicarboxylate transport system permease small subunit